MESPPQTARRASGAAYNLAGTKTGPKPPSQRSQGSRSISDGRCSWGPIHPKEEIQKFTTREKSKDGKFGSPITWNLKASPMGQIGVSTESLRKKASLYIYIYIYILMRLSVSESRV
jgi:hypothetical protein